mmetsp:Transcript_47175/g.116750  ORF Transcript_47175/g.116750 Transcript_47175/m.116750 type:complete len:250 (-) Transcript_47175:132-881(-)
MPWKSPSPYRVGAQLLHTVQHQYARLLLCAHWARAGCNGNPSSHIDGVQAPLACLRSPGGSCGSDPARTCGMGRYFSRDGLDSWRAVAPACRLDLLPLHPAAISSTVGLLRAAHYRRCARTVQRHAARMHVPLFQSRRHVLAVHLRSIRLPTCRLDLSMGDRARGVARHSRPLSSLPHGRCVSSIILGDFISMAHLPCSGRIAGPRCGWVRQRDGGLSSSYLRSARLLLRLRHVHVVADYIASLLSYLS